VLPSLALWCVEQPGAILGEAVHHPLFRVQSRGTAASGTWCITACMAAAVSDCIRSSMPDMLGVASRHCSTFLDIPVPSLECLGGGATAPS